MTAALAIPGLWLVVQYLPVGFFAGFIVAVAAVGLHEYFSMAFPDRPLERVAGIAWGIVVAGGVVSGRSEGWGGGLALATIAGLTLVLLVGRAELASAVPRLGISLLGVVYVGFFTSHFVLLRTSADGPSWVLFTVFSAMGSDTGGYFTGHAFGRHKLAPEISPGKTVEGSIGAVGGAMLIAWLCSMVFFPLLRPREALVLGAAISVLAQLGDLCESAIKRAFGAKDSGWIIPGHGGILDRLDSLLFPAVFAYYYAASRA
jgi:phosphatidate cytidylyltransferase